MKRFWEIMRTEFTSIFRDEGVILVLIGAMFIYGTLYPLIYAPEVITECPVAVVDLDNTPPSRKLGRMLDATPEARVTYNPQSLDEAEVLFMERKIYGVLYIPDGYQKRILNGSQNHVSLYADGGYFLLYSNFMNAVASVVGSAGTDVQMATFIKGGMSPQQAKWLSKPMDYQVSILYNPYQGYATSLLPPVLILIAQQLLLIGISMVAGIWYERRTWHQFRDSSAVQITLAKATTYLLIYIPLMLYIFSFQYKLFDYPMKGSNWDLSLIFLPYLLSIIFLGLTIGALLRQRESSLMLLVVTSVLMLMISGISWPQEGMPEWIYALGQVLPSSSGINALVRIRTMGATLSDVSPEIITLWSLTGVYALTAVIATGWRISQK